MRMIVQRADGVTIPEPVRRVAAAGFLP